MSDIKSIIQETSLKHIAIIMDGNRRWARLNNLPAPAGHKKGVDSLRNIVRACDDFGVKYLTVYAFSTENWNRTQDEVDALMKLLRRYLKNCEKRANDNDMRIRVIGELGRLDEDIRETIINLMDKTKDNKGLNFTIAINYGSRDEMTRAIRKVAADVKEGALSVDDIDEAIRALKSVAEDVKEDKLKTDDITEDLITSRLDTAGIPDPDLLIRTSGEERLSNYLLWQLAYAEFYFTDVYWPDFNKDELIKAIKEYSLRDRRFGKV